MLKHLRVQNFALINELELEFGSGLNIITGETGAGKSILLGAISLMLGQRSDSSSLLDKSRKCVIEGEFLVNRKNSSLENFFESHELDFDSSLILRREINPEGKSRSFINDTPVNQQQLKELGTLLVDVHSQHESLLLNQAGFQLDVVDAFAAHELVLKEYQTLFKSYKILQKELESLKEEEKKSNADRDYFNFQFGELEEAHLEKGELETLESELNTLTHAEEIRTGISQIRNILEDGDGNVMSQLIQVNQQLAGLSKFNSRLLEVNQRVRNLQIEFKDIIAEMDAAGESVNADPQRLEIVNDRIDQLNRLLLKHRLKSAEELIALRDEFDLKLRGMDSMEEKIIALEKEIEQIKNKLVEWAKNISSGRMHVIPEIENRIRKLLADVGMPNATFKVANEILPDGEFNAQGCDRIRFLFSANKGIEYAEISKVASGGEVSRLMLCLKAAVARLINLPSLIFDEIDTGVSGETAFRIGKVMQEMSKKHQLITITHLPQIASRGDVHFFVYKDVVGKKSVTQVKALSPDDRVVEIARMLSGDKPTAIALENAKELLKT